MAERTICGTDESKQMVEGRAIKQHPRLRIEKSGGKGSKAEHIYVNNETVIHHVTVHPSFEESDLRKVVMAENLELSNVKRVIYLSVGQMKHFKLQAKPKV